MAENTEIVKKDERAEIIKAYNAFNISAPATEDAFDESLSTVMQFMLFNSKWDPVAIKDKSVLKKIPVLQDLPLTCQVRDCPFAVKCPILKKVQPQDEPGLFGTECRSDRMYAVELFTSLVQDLEVTPENTVDLLNVASLVRLYILQRRVDWTIALGGMMLTEVSAVDPRTGQGYAKSVSHPLLKDAERLAKQISVLQTQLMANRKERMNFAATVGKGSDVLKTLFTTKFNPQLEAEVKDDTGL